MASFPLTWCLLPFQLVTSRSILHIMEGTEESLFAKCLVPLKEKHLLCCVYYLCRNWFLLYFLLFFNVTISCLLSFPPEISSARQKTRKQHHCMKYLISLFCELMGKNSYFKKKGGESNLSLIFTEKVFWNAVVRNLQWCFLIICICGSSQRLPQIWLCQWDCRLEHTALTCTKLGHWSIKPSIVYSSWAGHGYQELW